MPARIFAAAYTPGPRCYRLLKLMFIAGRGCDLGDGNFERMSCCRARSFEERNSSRRGAKCGFQLTITRQ